MDALEQFPPDRATRSRPPRSSPAGGQGLRGRAATTILGPGQHTRMSRQLSPYIRHRLVTEEEVLQADLDRHARRPAEVRAGGLLAHLLKGWLEMRPARLGRLPSRPAPRAGTTSRRKAGLRRRWEAACRGQTGIDCFDAWAQELRRDRLPAQPRADVVRLDLDLHAASCRWQLGRGFLPAASAGRRSGLEHARMALGRRAPDPRQDLPRPALQYRQVHRRPVQAHEPRARGTAAGRPRSAAAPPDPGGRHARSVAANRVSGTHATICRPDTRCRDPHRLRSPCCGPNAGSARCTLRRICRRFLMQRSRTAPRATGLPGPDRDRQRPDRRMGARAGPGQIVTPYAPVGPVAALLDRIEADTGLPVIRVRRAYDTAAWPHATHGFFRFKDKIPNSCRT